MKSNLTDIDVRRDSRYPALLTPSVNTLNILYRHSSRAPRVCKVRRQVCHNSRTKEQRIPVVIHVTIRPPTKNKSVNSEQNFFSMSTILANHYRQSKSIKSIKSESFVESLNNVRCTVNTNKINQSSSESHLNEGTNDKSTVFGEHNQYRSSTVNRNLRETGLWSNSTDFKNPSKPKSNRKKKIFCFDSICCQCSPVCLILSLLALLLLGTAIAAIIIAFITKSKTTTNTTITTTTTSPTTETTTTPVTTTSATTTTTTPCNRYPTQVTYPADAVTRSVTTADVNTDGKLDIIAANQGSDDISVFLNIGNGTFTTEVTYSTGNGSSPFSVAEADVNGDNKPDIIVANYNLNNVGVFLNTGSGTFAPQVTYSTGTNSLPRSVAVADVNGDNKIDILVANSAPSTVGVFLNTGSGTFAAQVSYPANWFPWFVAAADVDGDGKPDIVVVNYASPPTIAVLINIGSGTFTGPVTYLTGASPWSLAAADVDGDNRTDIIVANSGADSVSVLLNVGGGTFATQVAYSTGTGSDPWSVAAADINGDGKVDIIVTNYLANNVGVLLNTGNGTFATQVTYATDINPYSVVVADVTGDSKPDIIVANAYSNNVGVFVAECN